MSTVISKALLEVWAKRNGRISKLMKSPYGEMLLNAYDGLDTEALFKSITHGQGHIERTMLLGALIAAGEGLDSKTTGLLLLCCSYHDVGRLNDWRDDEHGRRSAEKIASGRLKEKFLPYGGDDMQIALAAIVTHSISDKWMENTAKSRGLDKALYGDFYLLASCLKDADNLDRVRLGDLDISHLRSKSAKALAADAQWIYDHYLKALK